MISPGSAIRFRAPLPEEYVLGDTAPVLVVEQISAAVIKRWPVSRLLVRRTERR